MPHTTRGPGLLESVYQAALAYELERRGLRVTRRQSIPVVYEAVRIDTGFHADPIVEDKVIVEIKAVETVAPVHTKQLLTYLKLADKRLGLLINFTVAPIKDGITRIGSDRRCARPARPDERPLAGCGADARRSPVPGIAPPLPKAPALSCGRRADRRLSAYLSTSNAAFSRR